MSESVSESVSDKGTYRAVWGQLKIKNEMSRFKKFCGAAIVLENYKKTIIYEKL